MSATGRNDSFKVASSKGKEKRITIKEPTPQPSILVQLDKFKNTAQSKRDWKRKVGESEKAHTPTQLRTMLVVETPTLPVSTTSIADLGLVIHKHLLFGMMIPFNLITPLLDP